MTGVLARKLWRDAWHYRGQFAAIVAVVTCGIALFVSLRSMHGYLRGSRDAYYARARFADVFARVERAPRSLVGGLVTIPGVSAVDGRLTFVTSLDVPGLREPAVGLLASVPVPRVAALNQLHLSSGRWPAPDRPDEVMVSRAFAAANGLVPGDSIGAVLNGRRRRLRIVALAVSPEFVYEIGPGQVFPDNRRFGVVWMGEATLAATFDMSGAVNDIALALVPGTSPQAVVAALDRRLDRYGGQGAFDRSEQVSHQFVTGEIDETQVTSILLPGIFLAVTAFLLHIVLSRLVATQRDQVATLKAFGYGNATIGLHYLGLAAIPVLIGCALGTGLGMWLSSRLALIYARFFQFPDATYTPDWAVAAGAVAVGALAGVVGTVGAVWRVTALPPAEAMRPEAPARFHAGWLERIGWWRRRSPTAHIIARNLARRPLKAIVSILGLGVAGGLLITSRAMFDSVDVMKEVQFHVVQREDVTVSLSGQRPVAVARALRAVPGVLAAEAFRTVPVRVRAGTRSHRTALMGLERGGRLHRVVGRDRAPALVPREGILVSEVLATILGVSRGDEVMLEVLEGQRRVARVVVQGTSGDVVGAVAYMDAEALRSLLGGTATATGAFLRVDPRHSDDLYAELRRFPAVSSVGVRSASLAAFERTIEESFVISLVVMSGFAAVITFGIVYNSARIALSERGRELASLRVLGFTRGEVASMLLGEQAVLTATSIPCGFAIAYGLTWLVSVRFESELFRMPVVVEPVTYGLGAAAVALSALLSARLVRGRLARLDLVSVLKTRE